MRPADADPTRPDPTSQPVMHCFDIRPLLDPPSKGKDKLDQILNWVKEQEPWLKPTHEPKRCEGVGQAG